MSQSINGDIYLVTLSGVKTFEAQPYAIVTYQEPQFSEAFNPSNTSIERIPMFIYYGGNVIYAKDRQGNLIAGNPDKPLGSG